VTFELLPFRFTFVASDNLFFPAGKSGNVFRGALGDQLRSLACRPECPGAKTCPHRDDCAYARFFEPVLESGPSGLADPPRPFVLRPAFTEDQMIPRGQSLPLDVHIFDPRTPFLPYLIAALAQLARSGLGPGRGRAILESVCSLNASRQPDTLVYQGGRMQIEALPEPLRLPLTGDAESVPRLRIRFTSPIELKSEGHTSSPLDFSVLIARLRDRIAALDRLYGSGTVRFDWNALSESASHVRTVSHSLHADHVERRSAKTRQVHPIGGFTGTVDYEGETGPFLPLLRVGRWTGAGRQTVWGKGAYELSSWGASAGAGADR
jgi:hypothetical protein